MDEQGFSDAVERLNRVNEAVVKLDPAIRAAAFNVLAPYVGESRKVVPTGEAMAPTTSDIEGLASEVLMEAAKDAQRDGFANWSARSPLTSPQTHSRRVSTMT
jgi:hypothetical protein